MESDISLNDICKCTYTCIYFMLCFKFLCSPKNFGGAYTVAIVSVHPSVPLSSYLLNFLSKINVFDKKCSLKQEFVDQGLSRSFWKVQGHSEHIKESNFNISSYMKFTIHQKLMIIACNKGRSRSFYERSRSFSACSLVIWENIFSIPFRKQSLGVYWNHLVRLSIHLSVDAICPEFICNTAEQISFKLYACLTYIM
jgi:hypothetical protein